MSAADKKIPWNERETRAWGGVLTNLAEQVQARGAGERLQEAFYNFLLENEQEIMEKSEGPARDFLMDMKARKERGFS